MANVAAPPVPSSAPENEGPTLLGHPRGLFVLFFAELWERFCYYGMRALLAVYVAEQFFASESPARGQELASESYGGFTALVYALGIFGGSIADRVLGYRRAIVTGGLIMAAGLFLLMVPDRTTFFMGLAAIVVGNGMFKPNISTLVGKLYRPGDPRRDGGFTIFYMGINIGAALAPVACQYVSQAMGSYRYGFMLAGIGMLLGLVCFGLGKRSLLDKGLAPAGKEGIGPIVQVVLGAVIVIPVAYYLLSVSATTMEFALYGAFALMMLFLIYVSTREETNVRQRMAVLVLLLIVNVVFWSGFEQAGNSLNFFAQKKLVPPSVGSHTMPFEWWQSVNAVFIVLLGPVFASLWVMLDKRKLNPSIPTKFAFGLIGMGLGFAILNYGIAHASSEGLVMWYFLALLYLVHTCAELCLSPVGLSMVTKLAPERMTGMVMGAWFLAIATGNYIAGKFSAMAAKQSGLATSPIGEVNAYGEVFHYVFLIGVGLGVLLLVSSRLINRWMHGVK